MRRVIFIAVLVSILFIPVAVLAVEDDIKITVDGKTIEQKDPPVIVDGRLMVSNWTIAEIFGVYPEWHPKENIYVFSRGYNEVVFKVGGGTTVNGKEIDTDNSVYLVGEKNFFPLWVIVQSFASSIEWDEPSQTVKITRDTDESQENPFIRELKSDQYSSQHLGIKTRIPKGSAIIAPPYSDHVFAYLRNASGAELEGLFQILVFPEASKTFGDKKAEDLMLNYLKAVEAGKANKYNPYSSGSVEILGEKDTDFLGGKARETTFVYRPTPEKHPYHASDETMKPLKHITVGLTRGDVYYQVLLTAREEQFDSFVQYYHDAVKNLEVTSAPAVTSSEVITQQVDITPITGLKLDGVRTIVPIARSGKFTGSMGAQEPLVQINNNPGIEYKERASLSYKTGESTIDIELELYNTPGEAGKGFDQKIEFSKGSYSNELISSFGWENEGNVTDLYTFGGEGEDRYGISFIKQFRASPESGFCRMGDYTSSVWIQNNNLVISIRESSEKPDCNKGEVIKVLADLLSAF